MSSIMMHVFLNDTHLLSLSPGPMGDISIHASVAAHDTTLDNSKRRAIRPSKYNIHRGARYDPQNGTSSYYITRITTMFQVQFDLHTKIKMRR